MLNQKYPKSFSHIGITVPNIHKAVKFYQEIMGWYVIMKPSTVKKENDTEGRTIEFEVKNYLILNSYANLANTNLIF